MPACRTSPTTRSGGSAGRARAIKRASCTASGATSRSATGDTPASCSPASSHPNAGAIAKVKSKGWKLFFKGGWGTGTGRVDHQVALLQEHRRRIAVAILTQFDPSHSYGKRTLKGVA